MIDNIKSTYVLKEIFKFISLYRKLKIVNYNKKNQIRLNLSINDYKKYSSFKIELQLIDN